VAVEKMKKTAGTLLEIVYLLCFAVLLYIDFFAHETPKWVVMVLFGVIIVSILLSYIPKREESAKRTGIFSFVTTLFLFLLVLIFDMMGGESNVGITLDHPIIWALVIISVWMSFKQIRSNDK
jgi:L-asparagine transporter-like permease